MNWSGGKDCEQISYVDKETSHHNYLSFEVKKSYLKRQ